MSVHHISIGDLELSVIFDGGSPLDEAGLANSFKLSPEDAREAFATLPQPYQMSGNPIYAKTGGRQVLVDVGIGEAFLPSNGLLLGELAGLGVTPDQIDTVIITHLHMDHFGGLRRADETATFPNAQVYVAREDWAHWVESGKAPAERVALLKAVFGLYDGRLHFYESGQELAPGITMQSLAGHTPGHHGALFQSRGKIALHVVDALHVTIQMANPDLSPVYDVDPLLSAQTRRAMFARAADTRLLIFTYHLPFPGIGYIVRKGDAFAWEDV